MHLRENLVKTSRLGGKPTVLTERTLVTSRGQELKTDNNLPVLPTELTRLIPLTITLKINFGFIFRALKIL